MTARGVFDIRLHVTGDDEAHVYELVAETVERLRLRAPAGVDVRWSTLRPGRSRRFRPTMEPKS